MKRKKQQMEKKSAMKHKIKPSNEYADPPCRQWLFAARENVYMMYTLHTVCAYQQIEFILSISSATNDRIN